MGQRLGNAQSRLDIALVLVPRTHPFDRWEDGVRMTMRSRSPHVRVSFEDNVAVDRFGWM